MWRVTPWSARDREVADIAEKIINSGAWKAEFDSRVARRLYQEANHMEVIDKRCEKTMKVYEIPSGTVFEGTMFKDTKSVFMRIGGDSAYAVVDLKNPRRHWSNQNIAVSGYTVLHGKITIERNA